MPLDYEQITQENERKYGTEVGNYGPKLLADRYSDPTHFVYELLQNAEDALKERDSLVTGADFPRAAKFVLFKDRLEFRHFGIPFAEPHIRAICDIARSSKKSDPNAIGRFGIGFKSVYSFSQRPEVHSDGEAFAIESLVRPIEVEKRATKEGETLFYLPFNHPDFPANECHRVISDRLRSLGLRTLLFLNQLQEIDWLVDGGGSGRYVRTSKGVAGAVDVDRVTLLGEENGNPAKREELLVFARAVERDGISSGKVQIAYQLQHDKQSRSGQIRRTKDSPLCVHFATDLPTHLGFLVQGPFNLTPSRDNIKREDKWNKSLVKEVGKLTVESLFKLKKLSLLSVSALDAMPLDKEDFETDTGKLFEPIYDAVLNAIKKHPLIPGLGKNFVSGTSGVLVRGRELANLFNSEQLKSLLGSDEECEWVSPDITADKAITKRLHSFLRGDVDVFEFDADDLTRLDEDFLKAQSVGWHSRLFRVLLKHPSLWSDDDGALRNVPIIKLADGSNVAPFGYGGEANAFLPADGESGPKTVHPQLLKGDALTFLRKLGLRPRDALAEVIGDILPQYESGQIPEESKHAQNLRRIFRALENRESQDHKALVDKLETTEFLRATNAKSGKVTLQSPSSSLYFKTRELVEYFQGNSEAWFLAEDNVSQKAKGWLIELGVAETPKQLESWDGFYEVAEQRRAKLKADGQVQKPTSYNTPVTDYNIDGLDYVLKRLRKLVRTSPSDAAVLAKTIWKVMCSLATSGNDDIAFEGCWEKRKGSYKFEGDRFDAYFVERLREEVWLPDRNGNFGRPAEIQERQLPIGYERNRKLCDALQFQTPLAEKLGISREDAKLLELAKSDPRFRDEFMRAWKKRGVSSPTPTKEQKESVVPTAASQQIQSANGNSPLGQIERDADADTKSEGVKKPPTPTAETRSEASSEEDEQSTVSEQADRTPRTDHLQTRIRVVRGTESESTPESQEMAESRSRIDKSGIAAVIVFEQNAGRFVTELAHNHPGYDLESRNTKGELLRKIEVKSTGLDWNGVLLSATQFHAAQELGDMYWLYVVENADSNMPVVYPIQNPAGLAEKFIFDGGWKAVSAVLSENCNQPDAE